MRTSSFARPSSEPFDMTGKLDSASILARRLAVLLHLWAAGRPRVMAPRQSSLSFHALIAMAQRAALADVGRTMARSRNPTDSKFTPRIQAPTSYARTVRRLQLREETGVG